MCMLLSILLLSTDTRRSVQLFLFSIFCHSAATVVFKQQVRTSNRVFVNIWLTVHVRVISSIWTALYSSTKNRSKNWQTTDLAQLITVWLEEWKSRNSDQRSRDNWNFHGRCYMTLTLIIWPWKHNKFICQVR